MVWQSILQSTLRLSRNKVNGELYAQASDRTLGSDFSSTSDRRAIGQGSIPAEKRALLNLVMNYVYLQICNFTKPLSLQGLIASLQNRDFHNSYFDSATPTLVCLRWNVAIKCKQHSKVREHN